MTTATLTFEADIKLHEKLCALARAKGRDIEDVIRELLARGMERKERG